MRVTIDIDLPEGQQLPTATDILRLTSKDWIASWWHIEDVKGCVDYDLTDDQAREVLRIADKTHDAENGINWIVLQTIADKLTGE
jgi:hypothetical protein